VSSPALELMLSCLCVVIFEEPFPIYPKKYEIRQYIEISLEARKRNSQLSVETFERINTGINFFFTVSEDTARFMLEVSLQLITTYFFRPSFPSFCSSTAQLGQWRLILAVYKSHTESAGVPWTSHQPVAQTATYNTHNKHNGRTSIPSAGLETTIPTTVRLRNYALNFTTTKIGLYIFV
jgi:hypothetical protein